MFAGGTTICGAGRCWANSGRMIEAAIPALRRYARALTRDAETADDLVQDTLVRALRSEHLFHGGDVRGVALHDPDQSQPQPAALAVAPSGH